MGIDVINVLDKNFNDVEEFLKSSPSMHYKAYKIPKRTIGFRIIAQPSKKLKKIQKYLVEEIFEHCRIHESAKAYIKNKSIIDNALAHKNSNYLLKLDIENFFNKITPKMFFQELAKQDIDVSKSDMIALEQLCFWNRSKKENATLVLSIGAPSSPIISNIIMWDFDRNIHRYCLHKNVNYSRYADDMTFSSKEKGVLRDVLIEVTRMLTSHFEGRLKLNSEKTVFSSKAHNRHVTGITLANNNRLTIGRKKKKYIFSLIHKFKYNMLDTDDIQHLKGLISYAQSVENDFVANIRKKYTDEIITNIFTYSSR